MSDAVTLTLAGTDEQPPRPHGHTDTAVHHPTSRAVGHRPGGSGQKERS